MRLMENMAEAVRHRLRSFLKIEPAQGNVITLHETADFNTNVAKNRIWYRGDGDELAQFYKAIGGIENTQRFWAAVPTAGMEIRKIHTGLPGIMVDMLSGIVVRDMNGIEVEGAEADVWESIASENKFDELLKEAIAETLVTGDGAFKLTYNTDISQYPIIEFVGADHIDILRERGRVTGIVFKTLYTHDHGSYLLEETYKKNLITARLYKEGREVPLASLPETAGMPGTVSYNGDFMMALPFMVYKSNKWKGRGKSIYEGKTDNFDALDEAWSQWMDALRKGRAREYIPSSMIPRNPHTGGLMKPNAFDNSFIEIEAGMNEGGGAKIELEQPNIPHESYLATYITALDLCLQGIVSPSTLGIDTKKLDNAEAQREKEKTTLYTRNGIIDAVIKTIPRLIDISIKAYATYKKSALKDIKAEITFGEYANPSFESQVETVSKAKSGGIMSIEAAVEELYGDDKDDEWKAAEVIRLKAEQGIQEMEEPSVNQDMFPQEESAAEDDKKTTMLNGAQIGSLMNIIAMVKGGQLTRNEAINITTSTLGISRERAETFIEEGI